MRFWRVLLPISKVPTNRRAFWWWVGAKVFWWIGGPTLLIALFLLTVTVPVLDFLVGDLAGTGTGDIVGGQVALNTATQAKNLALRSVYHSIANVWQVGLSPAQITEVQDAQVNVPTAVLLALQKIQDNFAAPDPTLLYAALHPSYQWQTFRLMTHRYKAVPFREDSKRAPIRLMHCQVTTGLSMRTVLVRAVTWDGTLTDRYQVVKVGKAACVGSGVRTTTEHLRLVFSSRTYSWSRVWHALASQSEGPITSDTQGMRDLLASLIATQDPSLEDPYVQAMINSWLTTGVFVSGAAFPHLWGDSAVHTAANTSVLHNVLRWHSEIDADAAQFNVPAVFVAAVMAQESGGREHGADGQVLTSGVGSNGLGALGLMQVEPSTASSLSVDGTSIGSQAVADLANGPENLVIGVAYLADLYHEFHDSIVAAASAYNAGPGAEVQALSQGQLVVQNGQTIAYVSRIESQWIPLFAPYFTGGSRVK